MLQPPQEDNRPAQSASIRPSREHIALAAALVKSKPFDLSVREYIGFLQQHLAKGRQQDAISSKHQHLDKSAYWRSEYERTRLALKEAEEQSVNLRREVESLKDKLDNVRPATASKKRRKQDEDTIAVPRSPKRIKRAASPTRFAPLDIAVEEDVGAAGQSGNDLLRSVFEIHATVKVIGKTDTTKLAYHVIKVASSITQIVKQDIEHCLAAETSSLRNLTSTLTVAGRAVASIFVGFNRLCNAPEGSLVQGKGVHAIVLMFKEILSEFEWISSAEVEKAENETLKSKGKKASASKGKSKARSTMIQESPALAILAAFLKSIINMLDPKVDGNKALFEGIAYCVIHRLGKRLFPTVFGHARAPSLEAEILQSKGGDEIEDDEAVSPTQENENTQKQIKIEAPYLIHLLNTIMAIAPAYLGATMSTRTGKPKQANNKGSMKGALAISAKDCLQRTLVNAIFGVEGIDENDPFMDCLKMPLPGNATIPMPKVKEQEVGEWFKGEIWNLLGWEILSKTEVL